MLKALFIVLGGGLGTFMRYAVSGVAYRYFDSGFPWGTLIVNLIGSFIIGFLWEVFERAVVSPDVKMFVLLGIIGAFTTFSAYSLETMAMFRSGEVKLAVLNILASNLLGLVLVVFGFFSSRMVFSLAG